MISHGMSDKAILAELGSRLKRLRLERNVSQQDLADAAGVHRTTVSEVERGASTSLLTLIQMLRALDSLDQLDAMLPAPGPSPLELARLQGRRRRRASRRRAADDGEDPSW